MNINGTKRNSGIAAGIAALMTVAAMVGSAAPASASGLSDLFGGGGNKRQNRQGDKNNMRNLGIGLGAAAVLSAVKGKGTQALVLGAGAAYAGKKYDDARKAQNDDRENRRYRYSRDDRYSDSDRYSRNDHNYRDDRGDFRYHERHDSDNHDYHNHR